MIQPKNLVKMIMLLGFLFKGSIHDRYLHEVISKKAHPAKAYQGSIIGSSFQVKFKGIRLTITNNHVCSYIRDNTNLKIGNVTSKILLNSPDHDICILEPIGDKYFTLASSINRGDKIYIIGNPRGDSQSISEGRIVGKSTSSFPWLPRAGYIPYLKTTAIAYPGNSGSPVVNRTGNVVGILFAGTSIEYSNVNLIVPLESLKEVLNAYVRRR